MWVHIIVLLVKNACIECEIILSWLKWLKREKKIRKASCKWCDGVNLAYARGTANLHSHLESKHLLSVAESSEKKAGKKQLLPSNCKKCAPEWAKSIKWRWYYNCIVGNFQRVFRYFQETFLFKNKLTVYNLKTKHP